MNRRPRNEDLSISVFYTVCAVTAVVGGLIAQFASFYSWEPGLRGVVPVIVSALAVCVPVWWLPDVRRTPFYRPRSPTEIALLIWAWLSPIAAFTVVFVTLTLPWVALYKYGGGAGVLTIPAAALIVWLTWFVPESRVSA
jgi:hypothetical protein